MMNLWIATLLISSSTAWPITLEGIRFSLPYTLGTHHGQVDVKSIRNSIRLEPKTLQVGGILEVPIAAITMDGEKLTCHMIEALGLNYERSPFPESHVCKDGKIPSDPENAIEFPWISFSPTRVVRISESEYLVSGEWQIRGKKKPTEIAFQLNDDTFQGQATFALSDFGIVVKPFLFVKVKDSVSVTITLKTPIQRSKI